MPKLHCRRWHGQYSSEIQSWHLSKGFELNDPTFSIFPTLNLSSLAGILRQIEILRGDYVLAQKEGIAGAGQDLLPPQSEKCKKVLRDIEIILNCIDRNTRATQENFPAGAKMFVVGWPFWSDLFKEVQFFAYNIYEDSGLNRDMEINFKRHVFRLYETKYMKFTRDGKVKR